MSGGSRAVVDRVGASLAYKNILCEGNLLKEQVVAVPAVEHVRVGEVRLRPVTAGDGVIVVPTVDRHRDVLVKHSRYGLGSTDGRSALSGNNVVAGTRAKHKVRKARDAEIRIGAGRRSLASRDPTLRRARTEPKGSVGGAR